MLEAHFQRRCDPVDIRLQQFVAEIPWRFALGPGHAGFLIGTHEHPAAFLAQVELTVKIDRVHDFLAGGGVDLGDLGHVLGDEIHVFHGKDRQLQPDHAPHFARPETARVHDMLAGHIALVGDNLPLARGQQVDLFDLGVRVDLGALEAGGLGIGMSDARGIEVAIHHGLQPADKTGRIQQRHDLMRFFRRDHPAFDVQIPALGQSGLQPVEALLGCGHHNAAGHMEARGLAREFFDLLVEVDRVFLQLGNVRIAVDGVTTAGRVPGGSGSQFIALQQHDI